MAIKNVICVTRYVDYVTPDGTKLSGCKIFVTEPASSIDKNKKGFIVTQLSAPVHVYDQFQDVPGQYDLNIDLTSGKMAGAAKITVQSATKVQK